MITETILQAQIIKKLEESNLIDLIKNNDKIHSILENYSKDGVLPYLSIDYILKLNYYNGCKIVLDGFIDEEYGNRLDILNGNSINNISLDKNQQLYPDLLLYNKSKNKYIIGELKRSKGAERQAITELLGYLLEIKNHLPLISKSEVLLVLIATEFSVLLQHSIESLILDCIPIICLKPIIKDNQFEHFEVFYPSCWTNTNYSLLQEEAFQGLTFLIDSTEKTQDELIKITLTSTEYIRSSCEKYKQHGFSIVWTPNNPNNPCVLLTIFLLNPYSIFNKSSNRMQVDLVSRNINKYLNDYDLHNLNCDEVFFVFDDAKNYIEKVANVMYESIVDLRSFRKDSIFQGNLLYCNSWGEIGDSIKMAYSKNFYGTIKSEKNDFTYPVIFFALYDLITENFIFSNGFDRAVDFFNFGVKIGVLTNLCYYYSSIETNNEGLPIDDNGIVDIIVPSILELKNRILLGIYNLSNSLYEIQNRYCFDFEPLKTVGFNKNVCNTISNFLDFVTKKMLDVINELSCEYLKLGLSNGAFFDDFFWDLISTNEDEKDNIENNLKEIIYPILVDILWGLIQFDNIGIDSPVFNLLIELSHEFGFQLHSDNKKSLKKQIESIDVDIYKKTMNNLNDNDKFDIIKNYFESILSQVKTFEEQDNNIDTLELLKSFDVEHLIDCVEKSKKTKNSYIHIKDNNSLAVAVASSDSFFDRIIGNVPCDKIPIHREFSGLGFTYFYTVEELMGGTN